MENNPLLAAIKDEIIKGLEKFEINEQEDTIKSLLLENEKNIMDRMKYGFKYKKEITFSDVTTIITIWPLPEGIQVTVTKK